MNATHLKTISLILRIAVAFSFAYPPIRELSDPDSWIGYFPQFIQNAVPNHTLLLHGFGVIEIIIALWLLSGYKIFWPSIVATAMLVGIVAFNIPQMDVVFRDLSIAGASLALALFHRPQKAV